MSTDLITFVPKDPMVRLDDATLDAARAWFATLGGRNGEVTSESHEQPHFYDAGGNFGAIGCPKCGETFPIADWGEWMGEDVSADKQSFNLSTRMMGCCGVSVTLNDLNYEWPMAFGKTALVGRDMDIGIVSEDMRHQAEAVMGTSVTVVYSHI